MAHGKDYHVNTRLLLAKTPSRVVFFGLIVLTLALSACAAPVAPATAPTEAPVAPTAQPAAPTQAPPAPSAHAGATGPAAIALAQDSSLGTFLADDQGRTLYLFTNDTPNTSNCYDKCEQAWPPLFTKGAAQAGDGVDAALIGTTTRKDGSSQVTYGGWPLYYFVKDQKPGDVTGQNVGGVWFVVSAKGEKVEAPLGAAASSGSGSPIPTPSTASSSPVATPGGAASSGQAAGQTVTISVKNFAFNPKDLTVSPGTTVVWHNEDSARHTVTSDAGLFDGPLPSGADFQFTFDKAGTYPYYCKPHGGPGEQGMSGVVVVQ
jgi:predicted lipoprotein with Yx(FWY)xxD motif/plastocyanin